MELVTGGQLLERIIAKDHYDETGVKASDKGKFVLVLLNPSVVLRHGSAAPAFEGCMEALLLLSDFVVQDMLIKHICAHGHTLCVHACTEPSVLF